MRVVGYAGVKATVAHGDSYGVPHDHWFHADDPEDSAEEWHCIRYEDCPAYAYFENVPLADLTVDPDWTAPPPPTVDPDFLSRYLRGNAERSQRLRDAYYRGTSPEPPPVDEEYAARLRAALSFDLPPLWEQTLRFNITGITYEDEENEYPD